MSLVAKPKKQIVLSFLPEGHGEYSSGELATTGSRVNRHIWKHPEVECEVEHDNGCGILGAWMLLNF